MVRALGLTVLVAVTAPAVAAASPADEAAIRKIVVEQVGAWNAGDGAAYSVHFAPEGSFTNIFGMVLYGRAEFEKRHVQIFKTFFKGTGRSMAIRRMRFVTRDVAIVDIDTEVKGVKAMPPGVSLPPDGVLRTRLQQVLVKRNGGWWIEAYHNVDLKPAAK